MCLLASPHSIVALHRHLASSHLHSLRLPADTTVWVCFVMMTSSIVLILPAQPRRVFRLLSSTDSTELGLSAANPLADAHPTPASPSPATPSQWQALSCSDHWVLYQLSRAPRGGGLRVAEIDLSAGAVLGCVANSPAPNPAGVLALEGFVPPSAIRRVYNFCRATPLVTRLLALTSSNGAEQPAAATQPDTPEHYITWLTKFQQVKRKQTSARNLLLSCCLPFVSASLHVSFASLLLLFSSACPFCFSIFLFHKAKELRANSLSLSLPLYCIGYFGRRSC